MVKYYIRISETKPLPSDEGLYFELTTEQGGEDKLLVLTQMEYNDVINEFNTIKQNFEEEYVQPIVEREVTDYMDGLDNVENATYVKQANGNNKYSYDALKSLFDSKLDISSVDSALSSASSNPVQNSVLKTALDGKASSSHTHDDRYYTESEINNDLGWKQLTLSNMGACKLYYNKYLCNLRLDGSYNLNTAGAFTKLFTGSIPSSHRPKVNVTVPNDGTMSIKLKVNTGGELLYYTPSKQTGASVRVSFIWARV